MRPDTIVYLGICIASHYENNREALLGLLDPVCEKIADWTSIAAVLPFIPKMLELFDALLIATLLTTATVGCSACLENRWKIPHFKRVLFGYFCLERLCVYKALC